LFVVAALLGGPLARGVELEGRVVEVSGKSVRIQLDGDRVPADGDAVRIGSVIAGVGFVAVEGRWRITRAEGASVRAEPVGTGAGKPFPGLSARIDASTTRKLTTTDPAPDPDAPVVRVGGLDGLPGWQRHGLQGHAASLAVPSDYKPPTGAAGDWALALLSQTSVGTSVAQKLIVVQVAPLQGSLEEHKKQLIATLLREARDFRLGATGEATIAGGRSLWFSYSHSLRASGKPRQVLACVAARGRQVYLIQCAVSAPHFERFMAEMFVIAHTLRFE
jgi:hypothetical protein